MTEVLIRECKKVGIDISIISGFRTSAEQDALYAKGRTIPPIGNKYIVTNAKAGQSLHGYRVAIDVVPLKNGKPDWNGDWQKIGLMFKKCGFEWGGDWVAFKDLGHGEVRMGYSLSDFQNNKVDWSKFMV